MYNEKSRKNLKPFSSKRQPKKNGRPKGSLSLTNEIKKVLAGLDPASRKPIVELLAIAATKQAMNGNSVYFREIIERIDGKVPDKIEDEHGANQMDALIAALAAGPVPRGQSHED
jgi:hypothetical protein